MSHCLICLEGAASVINTLPLAYRLAREDGSTFVMVASEHADILSGCSYVSALRWSGGANTLQQAIKWASETFKHVHVCMSNVGSNGARHKDSWDREAWHNAGYWPHWGTEPLVFDTISYTPRQPHGKLPLVAFYGGDVPNISLVREQLSGKAEFVPIPSHLKYRDTIQELLEPASVIVSVESPFVQLARAVKTPLIYLRTNTDRFQCSVPPPNHVLTVGPNDQNPETIAAAILGVTTGKWPANDAKLVHTSALHKMTGESLFRHEVARKSWDAEYKTGKWIDAHLHEKDLQRTSKSIGCPKGVHFVKDLLSHAASRCRDDNDIVVLTNADNSLVPGITERVIFAASRGPIYGHRHDFKLIDHIIERDDAMTGRWYPGYDFFAAKREWWLKHKDEMPDSLISFSAWDFCLYVLMRKYGGEDFGCAVTHQIHDSHWARPEVRRNHPGERYNQKVNRPYLRKNGVSEEDCRMCA